MYISLKSLKTARSSALNEITFYPYKENRFRCCIFHILLFVSFFVLVSVSLATMILFTRAKLVSDEDCEILINEQEYDYALSRLDLHNNGSNSIQKGQNILFLKGKINYMRGRYDLAINQLFKLVKEKYDYSEGFLYLGKAYEALGLGDKAKWAYERVK